MPSRRTVDFLAIVLLTLIWGTTWAAIRISLRGIPPLLGVALRFGFAGALLLGVALALRVPLGRARHERWLWGANAVLTFGGSYGIVFWAEQWVPSGLAAVLFATFPLWTVVLSPLLLPGERWRLRPVAGVVLGFLGVALIYARDLAPSGPRAASAGAVFLAAPLLSAVANLLTKRFGREVHPLSITAVPMLVGGALVGAVVAALPEPRPATFGRDAVLALAYLAVVGSGLAFSVYYWLLRRLSVLKLAMITYTAPVVAVVVGAVVFAEPLGWPSLAGGALVLLGVVLTVAVRH